MASPKLAAAESGRTGDHLGAIEPHRGALAGIYSWCALLYLLGMVVCWLVGIEAIPGHVTPFYAVWAPAFSSLLSPTAVIATAGLIWLVYARRQLGRSWTQLRTPLIAWCVLLLVALVVTRNELITGDRTAAQAVERNLALYFWHLPAVFALCASVPLFKAVSRSLWSEHEPSRGSTAALLAGLVLFAFAFAGAVAMIRGGPQAIVQPYLRTPLEYINDIGRGGTIRGLFGDFLELRPSLSLHGRVHPPGAVALLWIMSDLVGRGPWPLALATMALGATSVIPLYCWAKDVAGHRVALTASCLFVVMPSIVLFTATGLDITFLPFTLLSLYLFWRALQRLSAAAALGAGALYALTTMLSFLLISVSIFFGLALIWRLSGSQHRMAAIRTAALMALAFVATHLAVRLWSGFDVVECFRACYAQFRIDQVVADMAGPRYPGWMWKVLNPSAWFFFAGIPVSVLLFWRLRRPEEGSRTLFGVLGWTLLGLTLVYPARGEGERSGMYVLPFAVLPAAHMLDRIAAPSRSAEPLAVSCAFMAAQCWFIELCFYTYW